MSRRINISFKDEIEESMSRIKILSARIQESSFYIIKLVNVNRTHLQKEVLEDNSFIHYSKRIIYSIYSSRRQN